MAMMVTSTTELELAITGMTCAACAARIEKRLNHLDGVEASVNLVTERALVRCNPTRISEVVAAVEALGYGAHLLTPRTVDEDATDELTPAERAAEARVAELRQRLAISVALSAPVLAMSMVPALQLEHWQWVALTLTTPVAVWGAWPFHRVAWANLRHRGTTMDTLVSLGVTASFGWSAWALLFGSAGEPGMRMDMGLGASHDGIGGDRDELYLEVAATLTTLLLAGRYFEARVRRRASAALRALARLGARDAGVLREGREVRVPIAQVAVGDRFVVRPGERIATDGVVEDGVSSIDLSLLTGESAPVQVGPGAAVTGGTVNVGGRLVVRATRVGSDTVLAQLTRLVAETQSAKAPIQRLADRVSGVFVPSVLLLSLATLVAWLILDGELADAFAAAVAVLIISCPCALGLATPMALLVGTTRAAQLGIVIKGPEVLEATRRIDVVVLDKTGTVTTGEMRVVTVVTTPGVDPDELLCRAAAVEDASEHPVARAIVAEVDARGGRRRAVQRFVSLTGLGAEGEVDGCVVTVARPAHLATRGDALPVELARAVDEAERAGRTAVGVAWEGQVRGVLVVADAPKPTSAEAIALLRSLGVRVVLLTGDSAPTAQAVAAEVAIDPADVVAEVLPADKVAVVRRLQEGGATVAMVGDGVNDAAALAQSDLGIAMGSGTDVAIEASDLTIVSGDLRRVADAIRLARRTLATIRGNLFWAFAYNVAALPLAAIGSLHPVIAGLAMCLSSTFVVTNSLRLRWFRSAVA